MEKRGKLDCKFVCPSCGNEASPADFKALGADPQQAPQECIGRLRFNSDISQTQLGDRGCDWAAFGLFDICSTHIDVGGGKVIPVFGFAADQNGGR